MSQGLPKRREFSGDVPLLTADDTPSTAARFSIMRILILLLSVPLFWSLSSFAGDSNEARIVGGVEVTPKFKYPFAVRIWNPRLPGGKNRSYCCGTILNRDWILTAGHCVTRIGDGNYYTVGDHNIHMKEENEQNLRPKEIIIHERYRHDPSGLWDIALVRVEPSIRFSNLVSPINLPTCKQKPSYPEVTAIGWGQSEHPDEFTPALREGHVVIVPIDQCENGREADNQNRGGVRKYLICTQYVNGTHAFYGDSGGPIFQLRENGNNNSGYVQLGIGNFLSGKDKVYYADVAAYVGWIHRRISGCGNHPFSNYFQTNGTPGTPPPIGGPKTTTAKPFK